MPAQFKHVSDITMENLDKDRLLQFYSRMGLQDLKRRVEERFSATTTIDTQVSRSNVNRSGRDSSSSSNSSMDKYSAILDDGNVADSAAHEEGTEVVASKIIESKFEQGGAPSFYSPRRYDKPPNPVDYSDVPF